MHSSALGRSITFCTCPLEGSCALCEVKCEEVNGLCAQIDEGYLSAPEAVEFPTEGGLIAHMNFYAPRNKVCINAAPALGHYSPAYRRHHYKSTGMLAALVYC